MKLKEYMAPEMEVLEIKMQAQLMAGSINSDDDDDSGFDDGGGSGKDLPILPGGDM